MFDFYYSMEAFKTKLDNVQVAQKGYVASTISAKVATVALQTAITFGISWAIQALITYFKELKQSMLLLVTVQH